jgi:hypothetical protein
MLPPPPLPNQVPSVEIIRGVDTFTSSRGLQLSSQINTASVCSNARVEYSWAANASGLVPNSMGARKNLRVSGPLRAAAWAAAFCCCSWTWRQAVTCSPPFAPPLFPLNAPLPPPPPPPSWYRSPARCKA